MTRLRTFCDENIAIQFAEMVKESGKKATVKKVMYCIGTTPNRREKYPMWRVEYEKED